eukprot:Hpha_TRINITY_DN26243_c0_g1::TRINITY_DN26243_c0_g1_i1::g.184694::m.184694
MKDAGQSLPWWAIFSSRESLRIAGEQQKEEEAAARRAKRFLRRSLHHVSQFVSWHPIIPHLVSQLECWNASNDPREPPRGAACFGEEVCPHLDEQSYVAHLTKYSRCSPSCWPLAFEYLHRLQRVSDVKVTRQTYQRLVLTALSLAAKIIDDLSYASYTFALVGGVSHSSIVCMEHRFLVLIDWALFPSDQKWVAQLLEAQPESVLLPSPRAEAAEAPSGPPRSDSPTYTRISNSIAATSTSTLGHTTLGDTPPVCKDRGQQWSPEPEFAVPAMGSTTSPRSRAATAMLPPSPAMARRVHFATEAERFDVSSLATWCESVADSSVSSPRIERPYRPRPAGYRRSAGMGRHRVAPALLSAARRRAAVQAMEESGTSRKGWLASLMGPFLV